MDPETFTFDAADVADAIFGEIPGGIPAPITPPVPAAAPGNFLGWTLLAVLIATVAIAISIAVQSQPGRPIPPEPPPCGGLFEQCCVRPLGPDDNNHGGLFDAEHDVGEVDGRDDYC